MATAKLTEEEITVKLWHLDGWSRVNGNLRRIFEFENFSQAFGFMSRVALAAEKIQEIYGR